MPDSDYVCDEIVDYVVDLIGRRFRKSQIKSCLAKINGGKRVKSWVAEKIIGLARQRIREIYKTDPVEFKGAAIEFYESILRGKYSLKYKLQARLQLDKLLGLENISTDDPNIYAEKVAEALQEMDETILGESEPKSREEPRKEPIPQETSYDEDEEAVKQQIDKELQGMNFYNDGRNLDSGSSLTSE